MYITNIYIYMYIFLPVLVIANVTILLTPTSLKCKGKFEPIIFFKFFTLQRNDPLIDS